MPVPIPGGLGSDVKEGFDPIPTGVYELEVTEWKEKTAGEEAKNPGSTYISWTFEVVSGGPENYEGDLDDLIGSKVWTNTPVSGKGRGLLKAFLRACGVTDEEFAAMEEFDPDEYLGVHVRALVVKGKNPKTQDDNNSIRKFFPADAEL